MNTQVNASQAKFEKWATKRQKRGTKKQKLESDIGNLPQEFEDNCQSSDSDDGQKGCC
ncbi:hypothetical protein DAPPUDRAFT_326965 [Daphnia pulex]|uniref:Uncharacterized protein n=1 Tax=Daphnia pulex TaxID=6669 RepID=E9H9A7_DAPPU|nr:hypothetical protein DAPPUDRAFT_326965 [Daphnia pulex]|eukprot:EFX71590.1 hypothetical protein DAPPUDRAFT_326965 [Daphnia pulex]